MAEPAIKISAELTGLERSAQKAISNIERNARLKIQLDDKASLPLGRINKNLSEIEKSLDAATARVVSFGAAAAVLGGIAKTFDNLVRSIVDVEEALAKINVNFGLSEDALKSFSKEVFAAARNSAKSFDEAAKAAEELARQGLSAEETATRLNNALILSRRAGIDSADAVETLTAAYNSFAQSGLDTTEIINKLVAVDTRFAVSTNDLSQAISRAASTAQEAGVTFDEFLGIITAAQQTTARGGAVIGNALKTIFTRIQAAPETISALEKLGVTIQDSSGEFTNAGERLRQYARIRDTLSEGDRAYFDRIISGTQQINIFTAAINDLSKANGIAAQAQKISNQATNEAFIQNEKLNQTLKSIISQTGADLNQLFSQVGTQLGESLKNPLEIIQTVIGGIAGTEGAIQGIANVLSGPALVSALVLLAKTFFFVSKDIAKAISAFAGLNTKATELAKIQEKINIIRSQATSEELKQLNLATTENARKEALLAIEQRITAEKTRQNAIDTQLARNFLGGRGVVGGVTSDLGFRALPRGKGGIIPNFADPLQSAIAREVASGVPKNQIYVDKDPRVKSPDNPLGLLVANKRDEPLGGFQGVNRALREGANPKKYGGIPNFAELPGSPIGASGSFVDLNLTPVGLSGVKIKNQRGSRNINEREVAKINKAFEDYRKAIESGAKVYADEAKSRIKDIKLDKKSRLAVRNYFDVIRKTVAAESALAVSVAKANEKNLLKAAQANKELAEAKQKQAGLQAQIANVNIVRSLNRASPEAFAATQVSGGSSQLATQSGFAARQRNAALLQQRTQALNQLRAEARSFEERDIVNKTLSQIRSGQVPREAADFRQIIEKKVRSDALKDPSLQGLLGGQSIAKAPKEVQDIIKQRVKQQLSSFEEALSLAVEQGAQERRAAAQSTRLQSAKDILDKSRIGFFGGTGSDIKRLNRAGVNIDSRDRELLDEVLQQRNDRRQGRLNNLSLGLAFAAPFAAGFIPEGRGGTDAGFGLGAASGALQGAGFGGIFGPYGIAFGAALGAAAGALGKLQKSSDEVAREFADLSDAQTRVVNALSGISNIQQQLQAGVSSSQRASLINNQFSLLSQISPEARKRIVGANFSQEAIQAEQEAANKRQNLIERIGVASSASAGINAGPLETLFKAPFRVDTTASRKVAQSLTGALPQSITDKIINNKPLLEAAFRQRDATQKGFGLKSNEFNALQDLFDEIGRFSDTDPIKVTTSNFKELALALIDVAVQSKRLTKEQQDLSEKLTKVGVRGLTNFAGVNFSGEQALSSFGRAVGAERQAGALGRGRTAAGIQRNQSFIDVVDRLGELDIKDSGLNLLKKKARIDLSREGIQSLATDFLLGRTGTGASPIFRKNQFVNQAGDFNRNSIIDALSQTRGSSNPQEAAIASTLLNQFRKETLERQIPLPSLSEAVSSPVLTGPRPTNRGVFDSSGNRITISGDDPQVKVDEYTRVLGEVKDTLTDIKNPIVEFATIVNKISNSALKYEEQRKLILEIRRDGNLASEVNTDDPSRFFNEVFATLRDINQRIGELETEAGRPPTPTNRLGEIQNLISQNTSKAIR